MTPGAGDGGPDAARCLASCLDTDDDERLRTQSSGPLLLPVRKRDVQRYFASIHWRRGSPATSEAHYRRQPAAWSTVIQPCRRPATLCKTATTLDEYVNIIWRHCSPAGSRMALIIYYSYSRSGVISAAGSPPPGCAHAAKRRAFLCHFRTPGRFQNWV